MRSRCRASISPRTDSSPKSKAATSPVNAPREVRAARGGSRAQTGSRQSRWTPLARSAAPYRRVHSRQCCSPCPARPARRRLRPYAVVGDAIPESLTTNARRRGARACPGRRAFQHLHPLPQRPISRTEIPGRPGAQPRRFRQPLVRGPASASAGRRVPPQCRDDHAVLLPRRRPAIASGRSWRGKPILSAEQIEDIVAYLVTLRE